MQQKESLMQKRGITIWQFTIHLINRVIAKCYRLLVPRTLRNPLGKYRRVYVAMAVFAVFNIAFWGGFLSSRSAVDSTIDSRDDLTLVGGQNKPHYHQLWRKHLDMRKKGESDKNKHRRKRKLKFKHSVKTNIKIGNLAQIDGWHLPEKLNTGNGKVTKVKVIDLPLHTKKKVWVKGSEILGEDILISQNILPKNNKIKKNDKEELSLPSQKSKFEVIPTEQTKQTEAIEEEKRDEFVPQTSIRLDRNLPQRHKSTDTTHGIIINDISIQSEEQTTPGETMYNLKVEKSSTTETKIFMEAKMQEDDIAKEEIISQEITNPIYKQVHHPETGNSRDHHQQETDRIEQTSREGQIQSRKPQQSPPQDYPQQRTAKNDNGGQHRHESNSSEDPQQETDDIEHEARETQIQSRKPQQNNPQDHPQKTAADYDDGGKHRHESNWREDPQQETDDIEHEARESQTQREKPQQSHSQGPPKQRTANNDHRGTQQHESNARDDPQQETDGMEHGARQSQTESKEPRQSPSQDHSQQRRADNVGGGKHRHKSNTRDNPQQKTDGMEHETRQSQIESKETQQSAPQDHSQQRAADNEDGGKQRHESNSRDDPQQETDGIEHGAGQSQTESKEPRQSPSQDHSQQRRADNVGGGKQRHESNSRDNPQQETDGMEHEARQSQTESNEPRQSPSQDHSQQRRADNVGGGKQRHDSNSRDDPQQETDGMKHEARQSQTESNEPRQSPSQDHSQQRRADNVGGGKQRHESNSRDDPQQETDGMEHGARQSQTESKEPRQSHPQQETEDNEHEAKEIKTQSKGHQQINSKVNPQKTQESETKEKEIRQIQLLEQQQQQEQKQFEQKRQQLQQNRNLSKQRESTSNREADAGRLQDKQSRKSTYHPHQETAQNESRREQIRNDNKEARRLEGEQQKTKRRYPRHQKEIVNEDIRKQIQEDNRKPRDFYQQELQANNNLRVQHQQETENKEKIRRQFQEQKNINLKNDTENIKQNQIQEIRRQNQYLINDSHQEANPRLPPASVTPNKTGVLKQLPLLNMVDLEDERPKVLIVIFVLTSPSRSDRREGIRETWWAKCKEPLAVCLFVTDGYIDESLYDDLLKEREQHNDMLFLPVDEGLNFGMRLFFLMQWVQAKYKPDFFLRIDDDYFVCIERLLDELPQRPKEKVVWGFWHCDLSTVTFIDESFILLSYDLVETFLSWDENTLLCHPFGDQQLGIWLNFIQFKAVFDYRLHHHPPASKKSTFQNTVNICDKYLGLHGTYPDDMRKFWLNANDGPKPITTWTPLYPKACRYRPHFKWQNIKPKFRHKPELCIKNPRWTREREMWVGRQ